MTMPYSIERNGWLWVMILSVVANALLLWQWMKWPVEDSSVPPSSTVAAARRDSGDERLATDPSPVPAAIRWSDLSNLDLRTLQARLLAMGCPESIVKAILEVEIQAKYGHPLTTLFRAQMDDFWESAAVTKTRRKLPRRPEQEEARQKFNALLQEWRHLTEELLGNNWEHKSRDLYSDPDDDLRMLSFLPEAKRQRVAEQRRERWQLLFDLRSQRFPDEEVDRRVKALDSEHEAERAWLLTPEEREEYALRSSPHARFTEKLFGFEPTREEMAAIIHLKEAHDTKMPDDNVLEEAYRKLLGENRFIQFQRAMNEDFHTLSQVGAFSGLPEGKVVEAYEWNRQVERSARLIRTNQHLSREQQRVALEALQLQAEAGLTMQLGQAGYDLYRRNGGRWLDRLSE